MTFELLEVGSELYVPDAVSAQQPSPPNKRVKAKSAWTRQLGKPVQPSPPTLASPTPQDLPASTVVNALARSEAPSPEPAHPVLAPTAPTASVVPAPAAPARLAYASGARQRSDGAVSLEKEAYYRSLRAAVEQHRSYPRIARRAKSQGTVVVRMTVSRAGRLLAASVSRSSGEELLDLAALSAVRLAAPLPIAPAALASDPVTVDMPFVFRLQ